MATVALLAAVVSIVVRHQPQDAAIRIYEQRRLNEPASGNV
jgi:hypothetical protein